MAIKATSTDNHEKELLDFVTTLKQAALQLDTLGQIQGAVGGLSMASKAGETFKTLAMLDNYISQIEYNNGKGIR